MRVIRPIVSCTAAVAVVVGGAVWWNRRPSESPSDDKQTQQRAGSSDTSSPFDYATNDAERVVAARIDTTRGFRDCFRVIDPPVFQSPDEAGPAMDDEEIVLGIARSGDVRAYPVNLLNDHEMVRDEIDGFAILVTW